MGDPKKIEQFNLLEGQLAQQGNLHRQAAELAVQLAKGAAEQEAQASEQVAQFYLRAAEHYVEGGELEEAGRQFMNAATFYSGRGLHKDAALALERSSRAFERGGDLRRAAQAAEQAGDFYKHVSASQVRRVTFYMNAKNLYGNAGMYDESGSTYIKEMRCRLQLAFSSLTNWRERAGFAERCRRLGKVVRYALWDLTCLYGEGFGRVLLVGALLVAVFGVAYWHWGGLQEKPPFKGSLLYSLSVFLNVTLDKFKLHDNSVWSMIEIAEATVGTVWQAIMVSVVFRQLTRR